MNVASLFMAFPQPQHNATFLKRPQRFQAEMQLQDGAAEIVYFANSGSMKGCLTYGSKALIWDSFNFKRKRRYTLRAVDVQGTWVGTDTHLTNRIVEQALKSKLVPGLENYFTLAKEKYVEDGFRVDFILSSIQGDCLLEVKSATIVENGIVRYPDSVTPRGVKQLNVLKRLAEEGKRSIILFLIQRSDATSFVVTNSYDPAYAKAFEQAIVAGVEVIALSVSVSPEGFSNPKAIPYATESIISSNTRNPASDTL